MNSVDKPNIRDSKKDRWSRVCSLCVLASGKTWFLLTRLFLMFSGAAFINCRNNKKNCLAISYNKTKNKNRGMRTP